MPAAKMLHKVCGGRGIRVDEGRDGAAPAFCTRCSLSLGDPCCRRDRREEAAKGGEQAVGHKHDAPLGEFVSILDVLIREVVAHA